MSALNGRGVEGKVLMVLSGVACKRLSTGTELAKSYARWQNGRDGFVNGRSAERDGAAQRVAFLTAEALGSFHSIAVDRRDGAALQTLCVGSQWRRRISDRSVVASVRDCKREGLLLVLLMTCVYEATHAAFDLEKSQ